MHPVRIATTVLALGLAASACSTTAVTPPAMPTIQAETAATETGGVRRQAVTIRATVQKVDQKSRRVSLLGFDGTRETITVGPAVKNLAQVRKGDEVVVTYYQSVAFDVLPRGAVAAPATVEAGLATAAPGEMPGGIAAEVRTITVDVLKLDRGNATAVIRAADGGTATVDIQNPVVFDKVKVGDRVEVRLAEAMAVDVTPAGAH